MKVRAIKATPVNIPFRAPYRFSFGSIASLTKTVIEVETEDGVIGLGECADGDRAADVMAMGARPLQLDANMTWTLPTAREALRKLGPFEISWLEEPCETYEELAALRQHSQIAFSSHLIDLPKAARLGCPDAIVTNINELGGIQATSDFITACAAMDVGFRFHSGETGIASAAYLHLTASHRHVRGASQTLFHWYVDDVIEGGPHRLENGVTALPDGPGLGVTLDRVALARCHERYLAEGAFPSGDPTGTYGGAFRKV